MVADKKFFSPNSLCCTAKIRCHQDILPKMFSLMFCCSHLPPSKLATLATLCYFCFTFSLLISPQSPVGLPVAYSVGLEFCMIDTEQMGPFIFFRTMVYPKGNLDWVMSVFKYSCVRLQCFFCSFFFSPPLQGIGLATVLGRRQGQTLIFIKIKKSSPVCS